MTVQELSDIQDHKGNAGHTASELDKYLIEDRHYFHDQEQDDKQHHDDHDQRISNRTLDGFCQRILFLIIDGQRIHNIIQAAGLLTDSDHRDHVVRISVCIFQCLCQVSGLHKCIIDRRE